MTSREELENTLREKYGSCGFRHTVESNTSLLFGTTHFYNYYIGDSMQGQCVAQWVSDVDDPSIGEANVSDTLRKTYIAEALKNYEW